MPESLLESMPDPLPNSKPDPLPNSKSDPLPDSKPDPLPEPLPDPLPEPLPDPLPDFLSGLVPEPRLDPVPEPLPEFMPALLPEPHCELPASQPPPQQGGQGRSRAPLVGPWKLVGTADALALSLGEQLVGGVVGRAGVAGLARGPGGLSQGSRVDGARGLRQGPDQDRPVGSGVPGQSSGVPGQSAAALLARSVEGATGDVSKGLGELGTLLFPAIFR
mmetsp:Transcript_26053/g.60246  ORF Transcript_26053/g.60246 Transcript_26053/m.60246 type:complete len:219 (+) Transcript_26053:2478-3134(+)